jgi:peptide/nickel transport system ATP-binding protein
MKSEHELLNVRELSISFGEGESKKSAISDVSFTLKRGETLGIVGESGSGKSLTSLAIMGLLPAGAVIDRGSITFSPKEGNALEISLATDDEIRAIRGKRIAMIFQEPMTSLNPVHTCGAQVAESLIHHLKISKSEARARTISLFKEVELPRPEEIFESFPHQISGGQKQRVMIAMAMCCEPDIIIADEPTTALDVTVQKKILELLNKLKAKNDMGLIFITHDLGVVAEVADHVMVMYRGKVLEDAPVKDLFKSPGDPYTKALIACRPRLDFKPSRLPVVADFLGEKPIEKAIQPNRPKPDAPHLRETLIEVENLNVWFPTKKDWKGKPTAYLQAVNNVAFDVKKGETLGLVGESGCGKSTLGRALLRLIPVHSGRISYGSQEITHISEKQMRPFRKKMQLIFQDPYASLNPRMTIAQTLIEPLIVHKLLANNTERKTKIAQMLDRVALVKSSLQKYPHEFSGGQRQRICIARALMVEPEFIVCDESVSALDVSVQAQVLNLLNELKEDFGLTYIFISHDLSVVKYMSDRMIVMRRGQIEEMGDVEAVYADPKSAYTRELIEAIPLLA